MIIHLLGFHRISLSLVVSIVVPRDRSRMLDTNESTSIFIFYLASLINLNRSTAPGQTSKPPPFNLLPADRRSRHNTHTVHTHIYIWSVDQSTCCRSRPLFGLLSRCESSLLALIVDSRALSICHPRIDHHLFLSNPPTQPLTFLPYDLYLEERLLRPSFYTLFHLSSL